MPAHRESATRHTNVAVKAERTSSGKAPTGAADRTPSAKVLSAAGRVASGRALPAKRVPSAGAGGNAVSRSSSLHRSRSPPGSRGVRTLSHGSRGSELQPQPAGRAGQVCVAPVQGRAAPRKPGQSPARLVAPPPPPGGGRWSHSPQQPARQPSTGLWRPPRADGPPPQRRRSGGKPTASDTLAVAGRQQRAGHSPSGPRRRVASASAPVAPRELRRSRSQTQPNRAPVVPEAIGRMDDGLFDGCDDDVQKWPSPSRRLRAELLAWELPDTSQMKRFPIRSFLSGWDVIRLRAKVKEEKDMRQNIESADIDVRAALSEAMARFLRLVEELRNARSLVKLRRESSSHCNPAPGIVSPSMIPISPGTEPLPSAKASDDKVDQLLRELHDARSESAELREENQNLRFKVYEMGCQRLEHSTRESPQRDQKSSARSKPVDATAEAGQQATPPTADEPRKGSLVPPRVEVAGAAGIAGPNAADAADQPHRNDDTLPVRQSPRGPGLTPRSDDDGAAAQPAAGPVSAGAGKGNSGRGPAGPRGSAGLPPPHRGSGTGSGGAQRPPVPLPRAAPQGSGPPTPKRETPRSRPSRSPRRVSQQHLISPPPPRGRSPPGHHQYKLGNVGQRELMDYGALSAVDSRASTRTFTQASEVRQRSASQVDPEEGLDSTQKLTPQGGRAAE